MISYVEKEISFSFGQICASLRVMPSYTPLSFIITYRGALAAQMGKKKDQRHGQLPAGRCNGHPICASEHLSLFIFICFHLHNFSIIWNMNYLFAGRRYTTSTWYPVETVDLSPSSREEVLQGLVMALRFALVFQSDLYLVRGPNSAVREMD